MSLRQLGMAVIVAALALTGCSAGQEGEATASTDALVAALRPSDARLVTFDSPSELAENSELTGRGVIMAVDRGREIVLSPVNYPEDVDVTVLVTVELSQITSGDDNQSSDERQVLIEVPLRVDEAHQIDMASLRAAIGTEVVVGLTLAMDPEGAVVRRDVAKAVSQRAQSRPLFTPWAGGFVFEGDERLEDLYLGDLQSTEAWAEVDDLEELTDAYGETE